MSNMHRIKCIILYLNGVIQMNGNIICIIEILKLKFRPKYFLSVCYVLLYAVLLFFGA